MGYPQIAMLVLFASEIAYALVRHGTEARANLLTSSALGGLTLTLLITGGFYSTLAIPQISYTLFAIMTWGFIYINRGKEVPVNFYGTVVSAALLLAWFWAGGFFS